MNSGKSVRKSSRMEHNPKLRILISGVGNRTLPKDRLQSNWAGWVEQIQKSNLFEIVGAHDPAEVSRRRLIENGCLKEDRTYSDIRQMLGEVKADAILISSPAEFHAETIAIALKHNLHMLVEKPFVTNIEEGIVLKNDAATRGRTVAVVQNWRTKSVAQAALIAIHARNLLGHIGQVFFRYVRNRENPHMPGYIYREKYPLIYAMGVHHFDFFRYVLQDEIVSVKGYAFKPSWSLYESKTSVSLVFETRKGVTVVYSGTISSLNRNLKQESLIIEGSEGTLANDSDWSEPPLYFLPKNKSEAIDLTVQDTNRTVRAQYDHADKMILENFHDAVLKRVRPLCSAEDALKTIAVLDASVNSCESGKTEYISKYISD